MSKRYHVEDTPRQCGVPSDPVWLWPVSIRPHTNPLTKAVTMGGPVAYTESKEQGEVLAIILEHWHKDELCPLKAE